jgi:hypothetical protein
VLREQSSDQKTVQEAPGLVRDLKLDWKDKSSCRRWVELWWEGEGAGL